jgi:hypothetical protein
MGDKRTPTKGEQRRIDACEKVVKWASEDKEHRGCIILATDEESSTCAVLGENQNLISAFVSALKGTPALRSMLTTALMLDMVVTDGPKSDTDKDK